MNTPDVIQVTVYRKETYRGIVVSIGRKERTDRLFAFTESSPYFMVGEDTEEALRVRYERCIDNFFKMKEDDAARAAAKSADGRKNKGVDKIP